MPVINGWFKCIEETHLVDETKIMNDKRRTCHTFIRYYELKCLRMKHSKNKKQRGPIFVCDVPKHIKKQIAKQVMLISDENELNGSKGKEYVCPHKDNPCFINYIELTYGESN